MKTLFNRLSLVCCACLLLVTTLAALSNAQRRAAKKTGVSVTSFESKADAIIRRAMREKCIPGVALAIVKDGQVVVKKGYGVKSLEAKTPEPPDENTLFYIASLSKAITGFGLMRLIDLEKGQLKLTDKASKYIPDLPSKWRDIELRSFLAHQSGIPEMTKRWPTFNEMLLSADGLPMDFTPPGQCQQYNNFNFALAGKVIKSAREREIGKAQSYLEFMRQEVFQQLGMTRTGFGQQDANRATGYRRKGLSDDEAEKEDDQSVILPLGKCQQIAINQVTPSGPYAIPSGYIQTTLADLLKFYFAIQQQQLLTKASHEAMLSRVTPQLSGTIGWFESYPGNIRLIEKSGSGSSQGFSSIIKFAPEQRDAVILLMNQPATNSSEISSELLREVCGLPLPVKPASKIVTAAKSLPKRCLPPG